MPPVDGLRGAAMVVKGGSVQAELAAGPADIEAGVPCAPGTRFQLCSVSKQFAAAAVLLLAEAGRLDLHEPVARWLGGGRPHWRRVTLHHLLSHTAGIVHWHEGPGLDPGERMRISERLEAILATPLRSEPGARWHYSSPGFLLVGLIVERASGRPYGEYLTEHVLHPLKLSRTTVGVTPPAAAARGYREGQPVAPWGLETMTGTGDVWSTAGDLARFTAALHGGELLAAPSLRAMRTAHAPLDDAEEGEPRLAATGYGYGMYVGDFAGRAAYYHPGDNPGYRSLACWLPGPAAGIVILANDEAVSLAGLLRQLLPLAG